MKFLKIFAPAIAFAILTTSCCHPCYGRRVRTAVDVTPGHCNSLPLDCVMEPTISAFKSVAWPRI